MATRVTMRIFSCRPNPVRLFSDADEGSLLHALASLPVVPAALKSARGQRIGGLGFRGFLIEPVARSARADAPALSGPVSLYGSVADYWDQAPTRLDSGRSAEYGLLDIFTRELDPKVAALAKKEARDLYGEPDCRSGTTPASAPLPGRKAYAPNPWNSDAVIASNNCYNYANNRRFRSGLCATPGAGGNLRTPTGNCATIKRAVRADRLTNLGAVTVGPLPGAGWPVALFVKPGGDDHHFYRQDKSGRWSHKPGSWPARNCDEDGAPILNIRLADTLDYEFCGLFESDDDVLIER